MPAADAAAAHGFFHVLHAREDHRTVGADEHVLLEAGRLLEARVAGAHEKWVKAGGFVFRSVNNAEDHHNGVRFNWEMVPAAGGAAAAVGFDFLVLADDGRIRLDYQFLDRPPAP